jgi:hypothetical protein
MASTRPTQPSRMGTMAFSYTTMLSQLTEYPTTTPATARQMDYQDTQTMAMVLFTVTGPSLSTPPQRQRIQRILGSTQSTTLEIPKIHILPHMYRHRRRRRKNNDYKQWDSSLVPRKPTVSICSNKLDDTRRSHH